MEIAADSRRIAEDSKRIAVLTRRDSNDMRVIAAVTLLFLPGTFVAVCLVPIIFKQIDADSLISADIIQYKLPRLSKR